MILRACAAGDFNRWQLGSFNRSFTRLCNAVGVCRIGWVCGIGRICRVGWVRRIGRVRWIGGDSRIRWIGIAAVAFGAAIAFTSIGLVRRFGRGATVSLDCSFAVAAAITAAADQSQTAQRRCACSAKAAQAADAAQQRRGHHGGLRVFDAVCGQCCDLREIQLVIGGPFAKAVAVDILGQHQVAVAGHQLNFGQLTARGQEQLVLRRAVRVKETLNGDDLSIDQHDLQGRALTGIGHDMAAL